MIPCGPNAVRLRYASGFDTILPDMRNLAEHLRALGAPKRIERRGRLFFFEWSPIYPDAGPPPAWQIANPWEGDFWELVSVELVNPK